MPGDTESNTDDPKSPNPTKYHLHPAYSVTNINQKIRTLDGKKVPYSDWVKLFKLQLRAYKALNHIEAITPPTEDDPKYEEWIEVDSLVLQWIYSTVSDDILNRLLDRETTARAAWLQVQEIFINNKHARAATLEQKFTNTTLTAHASFDDCCQTLKDIARQLGDIDQQVSESRLVIQMVRGLPPEFDTIGQ
jgi:hypothetical protein